MLEQNYKELIIKELKGKASFEESLLLSRWVNESLENQNSYAELWSAYALSSPDVELVNPDKVASWSKIMTKISAPARRLMWIKKYTKLTAAAVLFFLIGIGFHYLTAEKSDLSPEFLNQYATVIVPEGQKSMIVLPDGSSVWLNSGSTFKYKTSFNAQIRDVEIEGEAYFDVKKDKARMFRVKAGGSCVEVYGTAFNVKSYKEEKKLEVTVEHGNVGVIKDGTQLANLLKGEQATVLGDTKEVVLKDAKVDVVTAWKNNELIFDGMPFEEGIRYLERWYGVTIKIEEKMKRRHNYTFKVKTESLTELLKLLQVITPLDYKIDGKNVTIKYAN
jgi:transmembrane sensor